jgi:hypothetical protein
VVVEDLAVASAERPEDSFSKVFPLAVFADAFPFILWAVIANRFVRDLLSSAFSSPAEGAEP